jgi:hypothetical protein
VMSGTERGFSRVVKGALCNRRLVAAPPQTGAVAVLSVTVSSERYGWSQAAQIEKHV